MFGLSFTHLVLLAVLALVFLGPEQLPELARTLARLLNEWKRATGDIQSHLTSTLRDDLNVKRMIDPQLEEQAKKDHALAGHHTVQDHPIVGPTIINDPHAPTPPSTGHTDPLPGKPEGHGDDQA